MQVDLAREKAAMNRTWAKREKQIETIVSSTSRFTGELQSLYGPSMRGATTIRVARMSWIRHRRFCFQPVRAIAGWFDIRPL